MAFIQLTILSLHSLCCTAHTGTQNHNFSNIIITIVLHISDRNCDFPTAQTSKKLCFQFRFNGLYVTFNLTTPIMNLNIEYSCKSTETSTMPNQIIVQWINHCHKPLQKHDTCFCSPCMQQGTSVTKQPLYHLESVTPQHESVFTIKHCIWLHTKCCISLAAKNY
jgi:hypothetical protein